MEKYLIINTEEVNTIGKQTNDTTRVKIDYKKI